ncbi:YraN family protein, partial [Campylobacter coli]|nr:YraN family protein [Campylobacter coli]
MGFASYLSGILGEDKACDFLKKQKFEILKRNFRSKFGEIDIIAKKDGILHFIEV